MAEVEATRSLRFRLALTYAGIALLTAAILGTILLSVLGGYYARAEDAYLQAAAERIGRGPVPISDAAQLESWAQIAALSTQTRVRVLSADGTVLADSGSPRELDPGTLVGGEEPGEGPDGEGEHGRGPGRLPPPLGGGVFGGSDDDTPRSNRTLTLALSGGSGEYVEVSEAPASGRGALYDVAQTWIVAAGLAVALAALAGYVVASRISRPVIALTEASDRMAEGDLSARAPVTREDEVGQLAESFNAMAGRIEATVTALRRFVGDAAHEIGTPLTALQADLELAEQAATTDDERRLVDRALDQARRLEGLSDNLLRLSRIESATPAGETTLVDIGKVVAEATGEAASRADQAGLELRVDVADETLVVAAEPSELRTVVTNLLDNAVKFTPEGGSVSVSLRPEGGSAVLRVADTGVGIPEAERAEVFERFHRGRNVAAYAGSGLGLAIVRASVERVGGSVSFESSESGTEFRVSLPLA